MRIFITSATHSVTYEFELADRYAEGSPMGEAEAAALNRLVAENIARNKTGMLRRLEELTPGNGLLMVGALNALRAELALYAIGYRLTPVASDRRGNIEREAEWVSRERECDQKACASGGLCDSCLVEGRRRVLAKAGIAQRALEDL